LCELSCSREGGFSFTPARKDRAPGDPGLRKIRSTVVASVYTNPENAIGTGRPGIRGFAALFPKSVTFAAAGLIIAERSARTTGSSQTELWRPVFLLSVGEPTLIVDFSSQDRTKGQMKCRNGDERARHVQVAGL
jgi:hypothetical protein